MQKESITKEGLIRAFDKILSCPKNLGILERAGLMDRISKISSELYSDELLDLLNAQLKYVPVATSCALHHDRIVDIADDILCEAQESGLQDEMALPVIYSKKLVPVGRQDMSVHEFGECRSVHSQLTCIDPDGEVVLIERLEYFVRKDSPDLVFYALVRDVDDPEYGLDLLTDSLPYPWSYLYKKNI